MNIHVKDFDYFLSRISDNVIAAEYEVDTSKLPALVFLQGMHWFDNLSYYILDGIPEIYVGDLKTGSEIFDWIYQEVTADEIEVSFINPYTY